MIWPQSPYFFLVNGLFLKVYLSGILVKLSRNWGSSVTCVDKNEEWNCNRHKSPWNILIFLAVVKENFSFCFLFKIQFAFLPPKYIHLYLEIYWNFILLILRGEFFLWIMYSQLVLGYWEVKCKLLLKTLGFEFMCRRATLQCICTLMYMQSSISTFRPWL